MQTNLDLQSTVHNGRVIFYTFGSKAPCGMCKCCQIHIQKNYKCSTDRSTQVDLASELSSDQCGKEKTFVSTGCQVNTMPNIPVVGMIVSAINTLTPLPTFVNNNVTTLQTNQKPVSGRIMLQCGNTATPIQGNTSAFINNNTLQKPLRENKVFHSGNAAMPMSLNTTALMNNNAMQSNQTSAGIVLQGKNSSDPLYMNRTADLSNCVTNLQTVGKPLSAGNIMYSHISAVPAVSTVSSRPTVHNMESLKTSPIVTDIKAFIPVNTLVTNSLSNIDWSHLNANYVHKKPNKLKNSSVAISSTNRSATEKYKMKLERQLEKKEYVEKVIEAMQVVKESSSDVQKRELHSHLVDHNYCRLERDEHTYCKRSMETTDYEQSQSESDIECRILDDEKIQKISNKENLNVKQESILNSNLFSVIGFAKYDTETSTVPTNENQKISVKTNAIQQLPICEKCGKVFKSERYLRAHREMQMCKKDLKCKFCGKEFKKHDQYLRHYRTHTGEKPYACSTCGKRFSSSSSFKSHGRIHTGERPYICKICDKAFISSERLRNHTYTHSTERRCMCEICGKSFKTYQVYKVHKTTHNEMKNYVCQTCGKKFNTGHNLRQHTKRMHTGVRSFVCPTCDKRFFKEKELQRHCRIHSGEKPYCCETCGKTFVEECNMNLHKRIHTGVKPYTCDTCGKKFRGLTHCKDHKRTHTGEKPYTCSTCGKAFARRSGLAIHKLSHSGERPYICDICGKGFITNAKLKRHKVTHSAVKRITDKGISDVSALPLVSYVQTQQEGLELVETYVPFEEWSLL